MNQNSRKFINFIDTSLGLIPSEDKLIEYIFSNHHHHTKVASPNMLELEMAAKNHRWKELKKIQEKLFLAFKNEIKKYEQDAISLFKLPSYEEIIRDAVGQDISIQNHPFSVSDSQLFSYRRLIEEWQEELIGTKKLIETTDNIKKSEEDIYYDLANINIKLDHYFSSFKTSITNDNSATKRIAIGGAMVMPIYQNFLLQAFAISIKKTIASIRIALLEYYKENGLDEKEAEKAMNRIIRDEVVPQLSNTYLKKIIISGGNRIRTILSESMLKDIKNELIRMSKEAKSVIEVARFLHKKFNGQLWYWNRIARSEVVLAYAAAFRAQGEAAKIKYVTWSAASTACDLCAAMDGRTWKFSEPYPEPVASTHPHCLCILIPGYIVPEGQRLQPSWNLASPYDREGRQERNVIMNEMDWDEYFDSIEETMPFRNP